MPHCEYCLKDIPAGEKPVTYFFIVIDAGTVLPKTKKGLKKHVEDNHHQIRVCKMCEKHIFVEREFHKTSSLKKSPSPKRRSSPKKRTPSPRRRSSPKKKTPTPKKRSPRTSSQRRSRTKQLPIFS